MLLSLPQPERMPFHPVAGAADEIADLDRRLTSFGTGTGRPNL